MSKASVGLFVPLHPKSDKHDDVSKFLVSGKELVNAEPETIQWYGVTFPEGNADSKHAIFDTFAAESGRQAHVNGKVAEALGANANALLSQGPAIAPVEILASMVRSESAKVEAKVGLYVPLFAKPGKEAAVQQFLISALPLVQDEPETLQWYAFKKSDNEFGIFDTAAGESGRNAHLNGQVAAALMANAETLLASPPNIQKFDILASRIVV